MCVHGIVVDRARQLISCDVCPRRGFPSTGGDRNQRGQTSDYYSKGDADKYKNAGTRAERLHVTLPARVRTRLQLTLWTRGRVSPRSREGPEDAGEAGRWTGT